MNKYIRHLGAPLALGAALLTAACTTDKKDDTLAQDSSLNRDLQMANRDSAAQPTLSDVPANRSTTPAATTPARTTTTRTTTPSRTTTTTRTTTTPTPNTTASGNTVSSGSRGSEGAGTLGTIAAGTQISLAAGQQVCTNTNKVGDRFTATVSEAVMGANGAMIPAGATAVVQVTELKRSENANDKIVMGFRVVSITSGGKTYPVDATTTYADVDRVRNQPKSKDIQKVGVGAAIGAVAGQVLGKSTKSTVIGAAAGAAAGTAAAAATANYEGCVREGHKITAQLNAPATIRT